MNSAKATSGGRDDEISALIATLRATGRRLEELTGGEVDTVTDPDGRTFLLRDAQEQLRHSEAARQAAILNSLPAHIALLDSRGVIISVNQAWRRFADANGLKGPSYALGLNYLEVCDRASKAGAADARQAGDAIRSVLAGEAPTLSTEYACHSMAEQRWFLTTVTPLGEGHPTGAVVMHLNITALRRSEAAARESEHRYHSLFENMLEGYAYCETVFEQDVLSDFIYLEVNTAFGTLTGLKDVIGRRVSDVIPGFLEDHKEFMELYERVALSGRPEKCEAFAKGPNLWLSITAYSSGREQFVAVFENITTRKRAEEALRGSAEQLEIERSRLVSSLRDKEALLKEVHHRVKNNMQVITSLLRLEANRIDHPITRSVLKDMQNRIQAMASLHEAVYRSNNFSRVDLGAYLRQLTGQLSRSLAAVPGQVSFDLSLLSVGLDLDQAVPCGLIVNELASNALKHGFPSGRTGEVRIELKHSGPDELQLTISDNGIGLPADFEAIRVKSLGLQLVSDLARQLGGRLRVGPGPQALFEVTFSPNPAGGVRRLATGEILRSAIEQEAIV